MMREFEIERQFNIKIETLKPNRGVYYLKTNKGEKCLKRINYGPQKLLFVYGAKEHLINNGYGRVDKYELNISGEPFALVNEDLYTLSQWIDGNECDFKNIDEVEKAARNLAEMHLASKGYEPPENSKLKSDLERWPHLMDKRIKALDKMLDMSRKKRERSDFDISYIKSLDFYKDLGKRARKVIENSSYLELCKEAEEAKSFCHHDYTYHNIVIDNNGLYNVIDFDYCKREIRVYDISNFMIKVLKRNNWDLEFAKKILDGYNEVSKLRKEEHRVLLAFLLFPQRYWRLANRYYYNEVNWAHNTFSNKIKDLIEEKEDYVKFIEEFKEYINESE
ncbi:CotS family spore coat protein [Clostridium hydrogeniformans]|uniref:CotS family spore coat protein n=1 Tax=Clostridium hydrogeniformans TaxID=349933 RepID=UPI0004810E2A|nr:CotS family spore coat protein [Clostridium hydrogeniformans]